MESAQKSTRNVIPFATVGLLIGCLYFATSAPPFLSLVFFLNLWILALYDWRSFRLPNLLTGSLFFTGLLYLYIDGHWPIEHHILGAFAGLIFFPLLNVIYKKVRKRDGVGLGDAKLLAGIGLWLSWMALPTVLFIASFSGLLYALVLSVVGEGIKNTTKLPFGPFLCLGAWGSWLIF